MSVVSVPEATPNRIAILCRFMAGQGDGLPRADVQALLSPAALRQRGQSDESGMAQKVIAEAINLKLVAHVSDAAEAGGEPVLRFVPPAEAELDLRTRLERLLLHPERAAAAGQGPFPLAVAWFLAQDPAGRPFRFGENLKSRIEEQCGEGVDFGLTGATRTDQFAYWLRYLGYAWHLGLPGRSDAFIPDPTEALARHLPPLLASRGGMRAPLRELVDAWGERCPVLEGGVARRILEERLGAAWQRPEDRLSRSTSLALVRLERRGLIRMERLADAPALLLDIWPELRPVSHISLVARSTEARR